MLNVARSELNERRARPTEIHHVPRLRVARDLEAAAASALSREALARDGSQARGGRGAGFGRRKGFQALDALYAI